MAKCVRCGVNQGVVACMNCLARLCNECANNFGRCKRCEQKRQEQAHHAGRKERLDKLDKSAGVQGMTTEQRQHMANMIYMETQRMLIAITGELVHMPLDAFLKRIDRSEAIAPLVNPDVWMKGHKQMEAVRDMARALNGAVAELERVVMDAPDTMEATDVWPNLQALKEFIKAKREAKADRDAAHEAKDQASTEAPKDEGTEASTGNA